VRSSQIVVLPGFELCCSLCPTAKMIDENGHVNVGYYGILFEEAAQAVLPRLDLSKLYRERTGQALFAAEAHLLFRKEIFESETVNVYFGVIDTTDRAIHGTYVMTNKADNELVAVQEVLYLHVCLATRTVTAMEPSTVAALQRLRMKQRAYPLPIQVGRQVNLRKSSNGGFE